MLWVFRISLQKNISLFFSGDYAPLPATIEDVFRADLDLLIRLKVISKIPSWMLHSHHRLVLAQFPINRYFNYFLLAANDFSTLAINLLSFYHLKSTV